MRSNKRPVAWLPWLILPVLGGLLWGLSIYVDPAVCSLHSRFPQWCLPSTIAIIGIPLLMAGMLGFILGKRFGKRETTRGMEHEFD